MTRQMAIAFSLIAAVLIAIWLIFEL